MVRNSGRKLKRAHTTQRMRYYCDYCDMYLPHGSSTSRRQHNYGWKHRDNYKAFYKNLFIAQSRKLLEEKRNEMKPSEVAEIERQLLQLQPQAILHSAPVPRFTQSAAPAFQ